MKKHRAQTVQIRDDMTGVQLTNMYRIAVPGGWIYYTGHSSGPAMTFVPDPLVNIEE